MFSEAEEHLVKKTIFDALEDNSEYTIITKQDLNKMTEFVKYCVPDGFVSSMIGHSVYLINGSVIKVIKDVVGDVMDAMNNKKRDIKTIAESGVGVKETEGKPDWDLVDLKNLEGLVRGLEYGCKKYAKDNWKKVPDPVESYYAAAIRHLANWHSGDKKDKDSGLSHLAHAMCNLYFLTYFENHPDEIVTGD